MEKKSVVEKEKPNSKPDRDLKRLAVIEKTRELKQEGVNIPKDIELTYGGETKPIMRGCLKRG